MAADYRSDAPSLTTLINELAPYPVPTPPVLEALIRRARQGDREAVDAIVRSNWRLAMKIAFSYRRTHVDILDLIQEGLLGLASAATHFDPDRKQAPFKTYAAYWIRKRCGMWTRRARNGIRHPSDVVLAEEKVQRCARLLEQLGLPITDAYLLKFGCAPAELRTAQRYVAAPCSLDMIAATMPEASERSMEESVEHRETLAALARALEALTPPQCLIIRAHFGLDGPPQSLYALAAQLGITHTRATQLKQSGLRQLHKRLAYLYT